MSRHLKAAGIVVRPPRHRHLEADPKAASQVTTDLEREPVAGWCPMASRCEAFRELIETALGQVRAPPS